MLDKDIFYRFRRFVIIAGFMLASTLLVASSQAQAPVAYWTFDDGSGNRAADSSGNGHPATLANGANWVAGEIGGAVSASAAKQQYVSIPAIDLSRTHAVTVTLWSNRTYSTTGGHALFEATSDYTHSITGFGLFPDDTTCHGIQVALRGDVGYSANCYTQPSSGVWHHLAVVFDKRQTGGNEVQFYVDGVLQAVNWNLHSSTNTNNFGNDPIYLFSRAGTTQFNSGAIDDLRIYKGALTAAQIQKMYNSTRLVSLAVTPGNASITAGSQQQFTATGTYGDGSKRDLTNFATWISTMPSVATAGSGGFVTGVTTGSATIRATFAGIAGLAGVAVTAPRSLNARELDADMQAPTSGLAYVQGNYATPQTPQTTVSVKFNSAQVVGDLNVVVVGWNDSTAVVSTVTDTKGNAYARAIGPTIVSGTLSQSIYYAKNIAAATAGANSVTVTFSTAASYPDIRILEYSGADPSNPVDVTAANSGNSATSSSGSATTNNATDLIFGANIVLTGTTGPGSGFTSRMITSPDGDIAEDQAVTTTGSYSATAPVSPSGPWIMQMVAFRTPANFTIAASPTAVSVAQGNHGSSTITTAVSGGFNNAVTLSASGAPSGTTVSFSPNPIAAPGSGSSTMTIAVGSGTATGTYTITVTGSGGGIQHTATVTLTVTSRTISYVQGNYATPQTPQSTVSVTFNAGQTAGNLNVVVVGWNDSTASVSSVVDSKGNTYTRAVGPTIVSGTLSQSIYYAKNIAAATAGSNAVTVTFASAATSPDVRILEYSGADPSSPVDVTAANSGNSASSNSGSSTTTNATDLIFAANIVITLTSGPGSGFTTRLLTSPDGDIAEDQMVTATGSYSASAPLTSAGPWIMQMVAFRTDPPTLVSIAVSPTNASIVATGQQQFTATGTYSDGSHQNLTSTATWTSSAPSIATISSAGLATGVAAGGTTIKATSGSISGSTTLTVTAAGDFTISASPASLTVLQGNQGSSTITTTISGGFNASIALSASGAPSGTTVSFNPASIAAPGAGTSTMTITVGTSTPTGTYPISVSGSGGGIQHTATVTLTVTAAPNFTISASPASLSVLQGNQGSSTITTTISGGFNASIVLSASGAPTGTTVSFNPATIAAPGAGSSTLTITVGASTPTGTYVITVSGSGGGIVRTVTVNLTVIAQVALSWNASTSQGVVGYNAYRSMTSGGPYTKLNSSLISTTNYTDQMVQSGLTYYYVTTAVNSQGLESIYSNEATATVP